MLREHNEAKRKRVDDVLTGVQWQSCHACSTAGPQQLVALDVQKHLAVNNLAYSVQHRLNHHMHMP